MQVLNAIMFMVSTMGNCGTFTKSLLDILTDFKFIYYLGYIMVSVLGLTLHEFFYSLMVSMKTYNFLTILYIYTAVQGKQPKWQVDKEAIGLLRVQ